MRAWKETLEDIGVMGLVPEPSPAIQAIPTIPTITERSSVSEMNTPKSVSGPMSGQRSAAHSSEPVMPLSHTPSRAKAPTPSRTTLRASEASTWEAPSDPIKNPSREAIDGCNSLEALNACICKCEACPLGAGRIKFVFGEGLSNARMMFVGEGPGRDEDLQGRPFVGRAGALLDKMIAALGMERGDVYIANIVKCRPPDNRVPTPFESQTCLRYLHRQIEIIKPAVLVGLGATPLRDLIGIASGITKIRGTWHTATVAGREIPFMPTFHPAYVLRQYTKEVRQAVWEDLQTAQSCSQST